MNPVPVPTSAAMSPAVRPAAAMAFIADRLIEVAAPDLIPAAGTPAKYSRDVGTALIPFQRSGMVVFPAARFENLLHCLEGDREATPPGRRPF